MSRRTLPPRATRGAKPAKTEEEEKKDNELYAKMFGADLDDDEDFILRQAKQNQRKERTMRNLQKYSYARGYTYCFDLDAFPRLPNHPSYAIDQSNIFNSTYHQQQRLYKDGTLGTLMNRIYFGLPQTQHEQRRGEGKTKNVCHFYLFENEDKKYQLDRMIYTFKKLHKHLSKLLKNGKIREFSLLKKDVELQQIIRSQCNQQAKLQALSKKIQVLQQRKRGNVNNWYYDDELFFSHSLNQRLHENVQQMKKRVHFSRVIEMLYTNELQLRNLIQDDQHDASVFIKSSLTFYNTQRLCISEKLFNILSDTYSTRILTLINDQPAVNFPLQVFSFGTDKTRQAVNTILANKIQLESQANYYTAKFAWRKLFKAELPSLPLPRGEKPRQEELVSLAKRLVEEAKYFYKKSPFVDNNPYPILDHQFNSQQMLTGQGKVVNVLRCTQAIQINGKQLMLICLYDWLCKAYSYLLPFADLHPDFPQLLTSDLFQKYIHGFIQAANTPIVGTLYSSLQILTQVVARTQPLSDFEFKLMFQWQDEGYGLLWRGRKEEEEVWETEKEEDEGQENEGEEVPSKKIKQNE